LESEKDKYSYTNALSTETDDGSDETTVILQALLSTTYYTDMVNNDLEMKCSVGTSWLLLLLSLFNLGGLVANLTSVCEGTVKLTL